MEITLLCIFFLTGIISWLLWKNYCLKRDIYDFTQKLDQSLNQLLNNEQLSKTIDQKDDLWGMVSERLNRISHLYARKNQEISEEKENLKELVSDISHQTKTPLANIKLYLELLLEAKDGTSPQESLEKINSQVEKLDFLLQSMVKLSRLETGTIKIQKSEVPIADTLAEAIGGAIPKADQKHISIQVSYDENLRLHHDKKWTAEAIFNLLDNAVKYTEEAGKIHISVKKETIFTKISISDTGKGIPLERHGTIFTRFYREPEIHDNEGIGIGLYLARKIISMQNGYIKVDSEVGKGSSFHIYLPNKME
ncbi:MAG: HAMP domain-containing histidine kinase [Lachnospiraceae bacterium]|nr:HAMP domain-containing histidine kinase [Lachnospiraceae bacterium]